MIEWIREVWVRLTYRRAWITDGERVARLPVTKTSRGHWLVLGRIGNKPAWHEIKGNIRSLDPLE
jgi:hypothetical protein